MATFADLRREALALPGAVEIAYRGEPWFNVGKKSFALQWGGRPVLKLEKAHQELLFEIRPDVFSPCKVATGAWSYVDITQVETAELRALVREAWATIVPKKISRPILTAV